MSKTPTKSELELPWTCDFEYNYILNSAKILVGHSEWDRGREALFIIRAVNEWHDLKEENEILKREVKHLSDMLDFERN